MSDRSSSLVIGLVLALAAASPILGQSSLTPSPRDWPGHAEIPANIGFYRMPAIRGETIVFVSEGDLWRVPSAGGRATRLTSHPGEERDPALSPDGGTIAFSATYEGPRDLYTMPIDGGLPTRRTYDGADPSFIGWTSGGELLYASDAGSDRGRARLFRQDPQTDVRTLVPLAECAEAALLGDGRTLVFTRLEFQGSHTDRYRGGTAQQLWRFVPPPGGERGAEAVALSADYAGTSRRPLAGSDGRVYFTTDRSGRLNLWSMDATGAELRQHTQHETVDIGSSSIDGTRIVYQCGPDLRLVDASTGGDEPLAITLDSDFDQTRDNWVPDAPRSAGPAAISPEGDRVAFVVRGRIFTVPVKQGRTVDVDPRSGVRYREVAFLDRERLLSFGDESGELELVVLPVNGLAAPERLTNDGDTLRRVLVPSPDGTRVAHVDKRHRLRIFEVASRTDTLVEDHPRGEPGDLSWSPDSRWLAYTVPAENMYPQIKLWSVEQGTSFVATTDRFESYRPRFSPDGQWLWFLSDRTFRTAVPSPWGPRQPEPFFDKTTSVFGLALKKGVRFPFQADDELEAARRRAEADAATAKPKEPDPPATPPSPAEAPAAPAAKSEPKKDASPQVEIDTEGLAERLHRVPVPGANMTELLVTEKALFWVAVERGVDASPSGGTLFGVTIGREKIEPKVVLADVRSASLSRDGKKFLVRKGDSWQVFDAAPAPPGEGATTVDLGGIALRVSPREEWRQIAIDAWRMLRDYFYDRSMHGVDWRAVLDRYLPWVDRVRSREELSVVLQEMTGELAALHHYVSGGDMRRGRDRIDVASLSAELQRDEAAGGWRVVAIPRFDPDEPTSRPPLAALGVELAAGDVLLTIDGVPTLSVRDPAALLRQKAGRQTLLSVRSGPDGEARQVIVTPISGRDAAQQRYRAWELRNRALVEEAGEGDLAYVHLRAMGGGDMSDFARDYYPIFQRKGLIIDVRGNRGGNIDSWILSRLMRKAWMFWNQHHGYAPTWNMQFAFRGPMVVLCDAGTASDGEAFSEGFRRLGLGKVIGTRTWGGEIWLSMGNRLVDGGIASAGEYGVFDEEGVWLIEGHGVEPDLVVDNPPHAAFFGEDAQLRAAIEHLRQSLRERPVAAPTVPPTPNKAGSVGRP